MHLRFLLLSTLCLLALALAGGETADVPDQVQPRRVESAGFVAVLRSWCEAEGHPVASHGTGQFRIMTAGRVGIGDPKPLLALGEQALQGLETWTGRQGLFLPATVEEATANVMVIADDRVFTGFVQSLRADGRMPPPEGDDDLTMKLRSFSGPRFSVLTEKKFESHPVMPGHWAVRLSSNMGLFAFFAAYDARPEPWMSEGLGSELERVLCREKIPLITAIAYEDNSPDTRGSNSWARDVAELLQARKELLTVQDILGLDLIGLSGNNYKQMWSACQYIRFRCGQARGERNRFYRILLAVAQGTRGYAAVCEELGTKDPALSRAWAQWAQRQR